MASKIPIGIPSTGGSCYPPSQREADGKGREKLDFVSRRTSWALCLNSFCFHILKMLFSEVFPGSGGHLDFMVRQACHGLLWEHHRSPAEDLASLPVQVCWSWRWHPLPWGQLWSSTLGWLHAVHVHTWCPALPWPRCLCPSRDISGMSKDLWQPRLLAALGSGWTPADFL